MKIFTSPSRVPKPPPLPGLTSGYWWIGHANFGDLLTPLLMAHFGNVLVRWVALPESKMVGVGSVLDLLPPRWPGLVVGSGKLYEHTVPNLSKARVLALRGPLSAKGVKGDFALGDPGLLADELVKVDKEYDLGIVPHWSDVALEHRPEFQKFHPHIIRPTGDPIEVLKEIGRCRKVVSSSLHGVIVADAFGIPRRTEMAKSFVREGGDFKFRDHSLAVGLPFKIGLTQEAPRYRVQDRQQEIYDVLVRAGTILSNV